MEVESASDDLFRDDKVISSQPAQAAKKKKRKKKKKKHTSDPGVERERPSKKTHKGKRKKKKSNTRSDPDVSGPAADPDPPASPAKKRRKHKHKHHRAAVDTTVADVPATREDEIPLFAADPSTFIDKEGNIIESDEGMGIPYEYVYKLTNSV